MVLRRHPDDGTDRWRAWDAADELALAHVVPLLPTRGAVLLLNDRWGALATSIRALAPDATIHTVVESRSSELALDTNLAANALTTLKDGPRSGTGADPPERVDEPPDRVLKERAWPEGGADPSDVVGAVVVKVPRTLALLEDQLARLRPRLGPDTVVVGAGMTRHVHTSTVDAFERLVGPTTTTRAVKKARLLLAEPDPGLAPTRRPPTEWVHDGVTVVSLPGVFSAERLDAGTRLLLDHLPALPPGGHALDLGCGTGVLGTAIARRHPDAHVTFADDSYRAVASAEATWRATLGDPADRATFLAADVLDDPAAPDGLDLVLCNPPFHDDHAIGDAIAWRMFRAAHAALRPDGALWVVGNRHLGYHTKLRRVFGNGEVAASNPTFVVLRAVRTGAGGGARPRRSP